MPRPPSNGASPSSRPRWPPAVPCAQATARNRTTSAARRAAAARPRRRGKAAPPRQHGPYYQISYTWQGTSSSEFVRLENLPAVQQQLRNYGRWRALVDESISLGLAAAQLPRQCAASRSKPQRKTRIRPKIAG